MSAFIAITFNGRVKVQFELYRWLLPTAPLLLSHYFKLTRMYWQTNL